MSGSIKKSFIVVTAFLFAFRIGLAQEIPRNAYLAAEIPEALKEDANAVTRYAFDEYVVKGQRKVTHKYHYIVTVLNEKGDGNARLMLDYDKKFNSINDVQYNFYNAAGNVIKKYHKSDMYDRAASDGMSIITDDRILYLRHSPSSYPYTVETIVEETATSYLNVGTWVPLSPEESVQTAVCKVTVDADAGFRYREINLKIDPLKVGVNGTDQYTWVISNVKAIKPEENSLPRDVFPRIIFVSNKFQVDGLPGDFSSWQSFGKWQLGVNADVCSLSPARVAEIQKMTADIKTDKEKAKFLYEYMQQNMRYVSIQLGIGGLKPFPASFVDEKKYGDCKALTNYMYALLKAVNIPAYYAKVRAGTNEDASFPDFPFNNSNHIILCVPFKGDTTWLECTSNTQPFGKLGVFTENRNALLITEDGGKLVNTPKSTCADNQFNSEAHVILKADGGATATVKILSTGEYRSDYIGMASLKADEQKEYLIRLMNMKQPSVLEYNPKGDKDGVKEVELNLEYDKFCDVAAANKQFYRPRVFDLWRMTIPEAEKRRWDFYFDQPMQKSCVTTIDLPDGFEVETLPVNQALKFSYGNYEVNYVYNAAKNQVISTTKFVLTNQVIPAAKYTEMQQYMDNIAKAQNKKLVIRRKA